MMNDKNWSIQEQSQTIQPGFLVFMAPGGNEVIRFEADGKVFVRGEEAGYAKDILDGLRDFLRQCNCLPKMTEEPTT